MMMVGRINAREVVCSLSQKGSMMKASGVVIGSVSPALTFATISHPNFIITLNPIVCDVDSTCHSKFVLFMISMTLVILVSKSTPSTTVTNMRMTIQLLFIFSLILVTGLVAKIEFMDDFLHHS